MCAHSRFHCHKHIHIPSSQTVPCKSNDCCVSWLILRNVTPNNSTIIKVSSWDLIRTKRVRSLTASLPIIIYLLRFLLFDRSFELREAWVEIERITCEMNKSQKWRGKKNMIKQDQRATSNSIREKNIIINNNNNNKPNWNTRKKKNKSILHKCGSYVHTYHTVQPLWVLWWKTKTNFVQQMKLK